MLAKLRANSRRIDIDIALVDRLSPRHRSGPVPRHFQHLIHHLSAWKSTAPGRCHRQQIIYDHAFRDVETLLPRTTFLVRLPRAAAYSAMPRKP